MSDNNTRTQLWENVSALMRRRYGGENLTRLAKEAKVGPGSATGLKEQRTSVGIDILDKLARLFKVEPWQLLAPGLEERLPSEPADQAATDVEDASRQNALTESMVALELAVDGLAPELRSVGRDALRKWAGNDASASETAGTLAALTKASQALATQKKPHGAGSSPLGKAA